MYLTKKLQLKIIEDIMIKKVYEDSVNYFQVMDENGVIDKSQMSNYIDDSKITEMYKWMSLTRAADSKVISLQRQGRAVTYGPSVGEEATQVGSAMAMAPKDILVPNFRQHGSYFVRGLPLYNFFLYWKGYEERMDGTKAINATPYTVPVATQLLHAVGLAFGQKYLKTDANVLTYVGDGGTSEGNFYEALNFAGELKLPIVFIIENNQWAISTPVSKQTAASTLAQKAIAAGFKGVQVDGNDPLAVFKATHDALENADEGPMLIESITYRLSFHTTSDDPTKYRTEAEVDEWLKKDPLKRVRTYLEKKGLWNESRQEVMDAENAKRINEAVEKSEQFKPNPKTIFENIYSFMPDTLKDEEDAAINSGFWQQGSY